MSGSGWSRLWQITIGVIFLGSGRKKRREGPKYLPWRAKEKHLRLMLLFRGYTIIETLIKQLEATLNIDTQRDCLFQLPIRERN